MEETLTASPASERGIQHSCREVLRVVLNSLLDSEQPISPETWQQNAGFISAEAIGDVLGRSLHGVPFDGMARALLPNWTAKWVWADPIDPSSFETYHWLVENGLLGLEGNGLRIFFADDGRHFKNKEGGHLLPRLSEAEYMLSQRDILQVGLRGPREDIQYEPFQYEPFRTSRSVYERIREILAASGPEGTHYVHSVTTVVPGADWIAEVDLDRRLIDLKGQATPLATLARLAVRFFSRAGGVQGLDRFLGTDASVTEHE